MAIKLEFCNVIVTVKSIRERLGDSVFEERFSRITEIDWHDEHLFREGCMNDWDLGDILDDWQGRGFELLTVVDGEKSWKDLCVVNSGYGPSYRCDWIEYDRQENVVWLKGESRGAAIGPVGRKVAGDET